MDDPCGQAKLSKPALLLPGRLQIVCKAQRVHLAPDETYDGVWHVDGHHENIVAVVLYYYRYSPGLEGGSLEFVSRDPLPAPQNHGYNNGAKFTAESLPRTCKVPVRAGSMVAFSNHQVVHRVLRMVNSGDYDMHDPMGMGHASRDFVVLFVVDQQHPLKGAR